MFARRYRPWYPKAVDVLEDDWERMVAFYDFPEDHWKHLRTTNVVESLFAALRLRTTAAKRFKRVESATALIWKLLLVAEKRVLDTQAWYARWQKAYRALKQRRPQMSAVWYARQIANSTSVAPLSAEAAKSRSILR